MSFGAEVVWCGGVGRRTFELVEAGEFVGEAGGGFGWFGAVDAFHDDVRSGEEAVGFVVLEDLGGEYADEAGGGDDVGFFAEIVLVAGAGSPQEQVVAEDESAVGHAARDLLHVFGVDAVAMGDRGHLVQEIVMLGQSTSPSRARVAGRIREAGWGGIHRV